MPGNAGPEPPPGSLDAFWHLVLEMLKKDDETAYSSHIVVNGMQLKSKKLKTHNCLKLQPCIQLVTHLVLEPVLLSMVVICHTVSASTIQNDMVIRHIWTFSSA